MPEFLRELEFHGLLKVNHDRNGFFYRDPEPTKENIEQDTNGICERMKKDGNYDVGFVLDPDCCEIVINESTSMLIKDVARLGRCNR